MKNQSNGFNPKQKKKIDRHAKSDSANKTSKVYSKKKRGQG